MPPRKRRRLPKVAPASLGAVQQVALSIDLHGMRVVTALSTLDRYLRQCLAAGAPVVRVIHGHGSGTLKSAVRDHLRRHELVDKSYPAGYGDGGDGVTIAELNDGSRYATRRRSHNSIPTPPRDDGR